MCLQTLSLGNLQRDPSLQIPNFKSLIMHQNFPDNEIILPLIFYRHTLGQKSLFCPKIHIHIILTEFTFSESHFSQNSPLSNSHFLQNSQFENLIFHKIHVLKIGTLTKFTISKPRFSQNSHFQSLIFHKIHNFEVLLVTNFTL